ncbi:hypothetical protein [Candidatus Albibeggiatoa sp. nov. NOAA]|uniref:hypothetical protein n=1 Tax=Candidatus Albibeggiatoa sp. nov. NOAA TaxID=3162724 RepID=UPI00330204E1|nr:hypothetical protein [Thiotrichaceae bacterium]
MLDRTVIKPHQWDSFFYERWILLNTEECYAVQQWVLWLASFNNREMTNISDDALMNALVILDVLAANKL